MGEPCTVCGGDSDATPNCICGGEGTMAAQVIELTRYAVDRDNEVVRLRALVWLGDERWTTALSLMRRAIDGGVTVADERTIKGWLRAAPGATGEDAT